MTEVTSIFGIAAAICIGAASPGPSFIMVARTAASAGRSNGLNAAFGMGLGALLFSVASLLGLNVVFLTVPALYIALKAIGGLYLAYIGYRIWWSAKQPLVQLTSTMSEVSKPRRGYLFFGFATQISNPKTAIIYASVFAAFLPAAPSLHFILIVAALVFIIEAGWYTIVAIALSSEAPRNAYLRYKKWIDRTAGSIMGVLGLRLAASTSLH